MMQFHLHLVSDATGETLNSVAKAAVAQFENVRAIEHSWFLVRTPRQLEDSLEEIERHRGLVLFTLVDKTLRDVLQSRCDALGVPCVSVLGPVISAVGAFLGAESRGLPGRQHEMNAEYFARIEAMSFAIAHDDGQLTRDLPRADIVLVGVSRTSKTPTCTYLANRGLKAANIPVVPGIALPEELNGLKRPLIVGLTTSPDRLVEVRRNRLLWLKDVSDSDYADYETVKAEIAFAKRMFAERGWPVIDVTRRSIEETAAAILNHYARRREEQAL